LFTKFVFNEMMHTSIPLFDNQYKMERWSLRNRCSRSLKSYFL